MRTPTITAQDASIGLSVLGLAMLTPASIIPWRYFSTVQDKVTNEMKLVKMELGWDMLLFFWGSHIFAATAIVLLCTVLACIKHKRRCHFMRVAALIFLFCATVTILTALSCILVIYDDIYYSGPFWHSFHAASTFCMAMFSVSKEISEYLKPEVKKPTKTGNAKKRIEGEKKTEKKAAEKKEDKKEVEKVEKKVKPMLQNTKFPYMDADIFPEV